LSSTLVTIQCDLDLPETLEDLKIQPADTSALASQLKNLEFNSWLEELSSNHSELQVNTNTKIQQTHYEEILTKKQFRQWLSKIEQASLTAIDTETTHIDAMQADLVGISLATDVGDACYIPLMHNYPGAPEQLDKGWVLEQLTAFIEDPQKPKVGQNLKYDFKIFANDNLTLRGISDDTMLESYVLDSTARRHDMDSLALKYLNHQCIHFEDIAGKGKKQLTFNQIDLEQAVPYAAEDADITLQLHQNLKPRLEKIPSLLTLYNEIEIPLITVLATIERRGVLIDSQALREQSSQIGSRLLELEIRAYELAGIEFNLSSPKQLQQILFEDLKLPVLKKTPKGQPSTAEEVLQELALDYPLPKLILEYRSLSKLKSTYTDKLPLQVNSRTGRIHTSYQQAVTATGRLSSTDPNLQNIPIRTEQGRKIRQAFIAPPSQKIIAADYSQIELRIMAHLSQDPGLLHAFEKGLDVHRATAAEVFEVALDDVSREQRRRAKAINFGLIYGMSAFGLAKQLDVPRDEATHYMHKYFARYPGVETYMENIKETAREQGYVETLFGRRLYLPQINAKNGLHRQAAERTAINAPMQGTAADIIKKAMIQIDHWINSEKLPLNMIMQVHDELVFEAPEKQASEYARQIAERMSNAVKLSVPLIVDAGIGNNWDEAH
ncbi:MAG TPA: DNA polymerase I, partial [Aeromonadales bacterium]|nr:DNA polymerase I [Aeromonadales bacterium]